jgi:type I restriction enzyme S subunit
VTANNPGYGVRESGFDSHTLPPTISQRLLRDTPIFLPSLAVQRRVVDYLSALKARLLALQGLQDETAAELDALLPSILDRAFRGEL